MDMRSKLEVYFWVHDRSLKHILPVTMRPKKGSFEVRCSVQGELIVLVVDATANIKGFEHEMTKGIVADMQKAGVAVTSNSPVLASDLNSFKEAFGAQEPWNSLLLVSHGRAALDGSDYLRLTDLRANWFLANTIDMKLEDKAVFLAVCEGACQDATYVLLRDQAALLLTAPTSTLLADEARAFFPPVFAELLGNTEITPEDVDAAVKKHAAHARGKMTLLSAVGLTE